MKIRIIDLLNKIANGEIPKKFKFDNKTWYLQDNYIYCCGGVSLEEYCNILLCLNDEVEIVEEDKKIKPLHYHNADNEIEVEGRMYKMRVIDKAFVKKIDELIDVINNLKGSDD